MTSSTTPVTPSPAAAPSPAGPAAAAGPPAAGPSPAAAPSPAVAGGDLTGRVAVVTGASSGIGAAIARRLAGQGAAVAAVARRADRLAALSAPAPAGDRGGIVPMAADVTEPGALAAVLDRVAAELGRPDLVVANAGVMLPGPVTEARTDEWARMLDVNVGGVLATLAASIDHLRAAAAAGGPADLVVVSSIGDEHAFPGYFAYGATKAAVSTLTRHLRLELAPLGVRTMVVRPGLTTSELAANVGHDALRDELAGMFEDIPTLSADDVAGPVVAALALPPHASVSEITIIPTAQPVAA